MRGIGTRKSWCAALVIVAAALAACSGDEGASGIDPPSNNPPSDPSKPATAAPVTATVGSQGGKVANSDGTGVEIPSGALPGDVQVSVTPAPEAPAPADTDPVG